MISNSKSFLLKLIVVSLALNYSVASSSAAQGYQKQHVRAFQKISKSFEKNDFKKATSQLNKLSKSSKLNDFELSVIANFRGNICFSQDDLDCALEEFNKISEKKDSLPLSFYGQIQFVLAQVYLARENYQKAIEHTKAYLAYIGTSPYVGTSVNQQSTQVFLARAYRESQDFEKALLHMLKAINLTKSATVPIKSKWVKIIVDIYNDLGQLDQAVLFVDSMSDVNPKALYLLWIADEFKDQGKEQEAKAIQVKLLTQGLAEYREGVLTPLFSTPAETEIIPIYRAPPAYPKKAFLNEQEGWVDLIMDINKSGKTENIKVTNSEPKRIFDKAAKQAASKYIFAPILKDGKPVRFKDYEIRIRFVLE